MEENKSGMSEAELKMWRDEIRKSAAAAGIGTSTDEEIEENNRLLRIYSYKREKRRERVHAILSFLKTVFFTPIIKCLNVISVAAKIIGSITAVCMPYGFYCIYKVVVQYQNGVAFSEMTHTSPIFYVVILPFIAYAVHAITAALADHLSIRLLY